MINFDFVDSIFHKIKPILNNFYTVVPILLFNWENITCLVFCFMRKFNLIFWISGGLWLSSLVQQEKLLGMTLPIALNFWRFCTLIGDILRRRRNDAVNENKPDQLRSFSIKVISEIFRTCISNQKCLQLTSDYIET